MPEAPTTRDLKLIQYLNEAYSKEKELEVALKAHIAMSKGRPSYDKRLKDHLAETRAQAKGLERRIKQLGGKAEKYDLPVPLLPGTEEVAGKVMAAAKQGTALAKGQLHAVRGTSEAEKLLKNAKTELFNEFEEIGNYLAIEELASAVHDTETAQLARDFRKQEERMAGFLQKLIPQLTKQVVRDEIPAAERRAPARQARPARPAAAPRKRRTSAAA